MKGSGDRLTAREILNLELYKDYEWVCICTVCYRKASWYIHPFLDLENSWKWFCCYTDCDNDKHANFEDPIFKVIPVDLRDK